MTRWNCPLGCTEHKHRAQCSPGCTCGRHQRTSRPEVRKSDPRYVGKVAPYGSKEYMRRHDRCRRERGDVGLLPCERCRYYGVGEVAKEWARVHGVTGEESWHYVPLCKSCHNRYDFTGRPRGHNDGRSKLNPSDRVRRAGS